jgi:hypothetical protein
MVQHVKPDQPRIEESIVHKRIVVGFRYRFFRNFRAVNRKSSDQSVSRARIGKVFEAEREGPKPTRLTIAARFDEGPLITTDHGERRGR